jgi:hypothetical protein
MNDELFLDNPEARKSTSMISPVDGKFMEN